MDSYFWVVQTPHPPQFAFPFPLSRSLSFPIVCCHLYDFFFSSPGLINHTGLVL